MPAPASGTRDSRRLPGWEPLACPQSGPGSAAIGGLMYIGVGTLVLILVIVLIIYFVRRA